MIPGFPFVFDKNHFKLIFFFFFKYFLFIDSLMIEMLQKCVFTWRKGGGEVLQ